MEKINRFVGLDILRGLMAISVMEYHYIGGNALNPLGRLGIFAVSIFFILSGLSMAIVYSNYIKDFKTSCVFFVKRILRIWPLYWICTGYAIFHMFYLDIFHGTVSELIKLIFLNLTTMFGLIKPEAYLVLGGWSIGNEIFYYLLTPFIIILFNKNKKYGYIGFFITMLIASLFSFQYLNSKEILANQWEKYISPLNNLFLYYSGLVMYYSYKDLNIKKIYVSTILILSVFFLFVIPTGIDQISLVTGSNRLVFSILCMLIVFCFYKMNINKANMFTKLLEVFGLATYGVYLLHPIVSDIIVYVLKNIIKVELGITHIIISSISSIVISVFSYFYFERKITNYGKRIIIKLEGR